MIGSWREDDERLVFLPTSVIYKIKKGLAPSDLLELPISTIEQIKTDQLTLRDILRLAGVEEREIKEIMRMRRKQKGTPTYEAKMRRKAWRPLVVGVKNSYGGKNGHNAKQKR